jgi:hypothetical protein
MLSRNGRLRFARSKMIAPGVRSRKIVKIRWRPVAADQDEDAATRASVAARARLRLGAGPAAHQSELGSRLRLSSQISRVCGFT